MEGIRFS